MTLITAVGNTSTTIMAKPNVMVGCIHCQFTSF
jgi:hypothetical protein